MGNEEEMLKKHEQGTEASVWRDRQHTHHDGTEGTDAVLKRYTGSRWIEVDKHHLDPNGNPLSGSGGIGSAGTPQGGYGPGR